MSVGGTRPCRSVSGVSPGRHGSCGTFSRGPKRTSALPCRVAAVGPADPVNTGGAACSSPASSMNANGATLVCADAGAADISATTTARANTTLPPTSGKIRAVRVACAAELT
jgi:hypothetical protein